MCFLVSMTDKLPYSIRILLESAIRNCDNFQVTKEDVEKIIDWENTSPKLVEIPFKPARVLLQVCHNLVITIIVIRISSSVYLCLLSPGFYWSTCCCWPCFYAWCHEQPWWWFQQDQPFGELLYHHWIQDKSTRKFSLSFCFWNWCWNSYLFKLIW